MHPSLWLTPPLKKFVTVRTEERGIKKKVQVVLEEEGGVGRVGEGWGAKEKRGRKGVGKRRGYASICTVFSWHPCIFPTTNSKRFPLHYCYDRSPLQYEPARVSVDRRPGSEVYVSACNIKRQNRERKEKREWEEWEHASLDIIGKEKENGCLYLCVWSYSCWPRLCSPSHFFSPSLCINDHPALWLNYVPVN